jgi:hypothetical protein
VNFESLLILVLVALASAIGGFWIARRNRNAVSDRALTVKPEESGDVVILNQDGQVLVACYEVDKLPKGRKQVGDEQGVAAGRAKQIIADMVTRSAQMPGKRLIIEFDKGVLKGIDVGKFEIVNVTKGDGQRLMARAIDSKKFVGHGRFYEGGQLRQLGVGAFHIVSIAVAQAHLADINRSLKEIKAGVKGARDFLEDKDLGQLDGTVDYLEHVVGFIKRMQSPDKLPIEKRTELENIRRDLLSWNAQVKREADRLGKQIEEQEDTDTFGTGDTFEALQKHAEEARRIVQKYQLFLRTASIFYLISAYLDPLSLNDADADKILKANKPYGAIKEMLHGLDDKSSELLKEAAFNRSETLQKRQDEIGDASKEVLGLAEKEAKTFQIGIECLTASLENLRGREEKFRLAVKLDASGLPERVDIL